MKTLTEDYKRGARVERAKAVEDRASVARTKLSTKVLNQLQAMEKEVSQHHDDLDKMNERLKIIDGLVAPRYIISEQYRKLHVCQQWQDRSPKDWRTVCGWKYGRRTFERRSVIAEALPTKSTVPPASTRTLRTHTRLVSQTCSASCTDANVPLPVKP